MRFFWAFAFLLSFINPILAETNPSILVGNSSTVKIVDGPELPLTDVQNIPREFQENPFKALIVARFDREQTVGDAVAVLLGFVGYEFRIHGNAIDPMAMAFYQKPLPDVHRYFENVTLLDALVSLTGEGYTLVFDHSERAASVDMTPSKRLLIRVGKERV